MNDLRQAQLRMSTESAHRGQQQGPNGNVDMPLTRGIFCWPPCQPSGADLPEPWMSPMPLASQMSLAPPMSLSPQVPQMPPCAEMPAKSAMPRHVLYTVSIALSSHMAGLAQRS